MNTCVCGHSKQFHACGSGRCEVIPQGGLRCGCQGFKLPVPDSELPTVEDVQAVYAQTATRKGDWFVTYSGKQFWPLDPQPQDVCVRDIAHHLSLVCRFGGAVRTHYSVAQHSLIVADILPPRLKLRGLLHDATEAYVGDMVRPLKRFMPDYREVENKVWAAIIAVTAEGSKSSTWRSRSASWALPRASMSVEGMTTVKRAGRSSSWA